MWAASSVVCQVSSNIKSELIIINVFYFFVLSPTAFLAKISGLVVFLVFIVQATWMAYDMVVMRTNPDLTNSMRRLEEAFLNCREEMEKKWQEVLRESKGEEQKKE